MANDLPSELERAAYAACLAPNDADGQIAILQRAHPEHASALRQLFAEVRGAKSVLRSVHAAATADSGVRVGERIGAYVIEGELGRGAFGIVYRARQHEPVQRLVAVKLLARCDAGPEVVRRFHAERQVLAQLQHPGIAPIFDAGTTGNGAPWIAMELLVGRTITQHADERRLGVTARLRLFAELCDIVHYAHQRGVIHRDLKPANVFVIDRAGTAQLRVIDFGLAKVTAADLVAVAPSTTEHGRLLGTPEYMSPEQARGEDVDTRTDVHALGVMLCELLTGTLPFPSARLRGNGIASVVAILGQEEAPAVTTLVADAAAATARRTTPGELLAALRGDLDLIVRSCLHKQREQRYASVAELAADVRRHLHSQPLAMQPPRLGYVLRKLAQRHRVAFAAVAAAGVAIVCGAAAVLWSGMGIRAANQVATAAARAADHNAYVATIAAARRAEQAGQSGALRQLLGATPPALRNFEHAMLTVQADDSLRSVELGTRDADQVVALGERGIVLAHAASELIVLATDPTAAAITVPCGGRLLCIAVRPRHDQLAVARADGVLELRAADTLALLDQLPVPGGLGVHMVFSPDGLRAVIGRGRNCRVVDLASGAIEREWTLRDTLTSLAMAGAKGELATSDLSGDICRWDLATGRCLQTLATAAVVRQVEFSPDGSHLLTLDDTSVLRRVACADGSVTAAHRTPGVVADSFQVHADGSTLLVMAADGTLRLLQTATLLEVGQLRGHEAMVSDVASNGAGQWITVSRDGSARWWPQAAPARVQRLTGMRGNPLQLALHPTMERVFAIGLGGQLAAFELDTKELAWSVDLGHPLCHSLLLMPEAERLWAVAGDTLSAWSLADGKQLHRTEPSPGTVLYGLAHGRPGEMLAMTAGGSLLQLDAATGSLRARLAGAAELQGDPGPPVPFADGRFAAATIGAGGLCCWDLDRTQVRWWCRGPFRALLHDRHADRLLAGGADGTVIELDPATGFETRLLWRNPTGNPVHHLALTPDGQRLLVSSVQAHVLTRDDGRELLTWSPDRYWVSCMLAEPNRGWLLTAGGHWQGAAEIVLWPLAARAR